MSGRLEGRVAAITGAGSGIGRASARLFAAEGARLVLFDKTDAVEETAAMVESAGGHALAMVGDAGEERLLPETEPGMTFTIVWCTDRVLARIVVRIECVNSSHRGCHVIFRQTEDVERV